MQEARQTVRHHSQHVVPRRDVMVWHAFRDVLEDFRMQETRPYTSEKRTLALVLQLSQQLVFKLRGSSKTLTEKRVADLPVVYRASERTRVNKKYV